jgi:3' terminal RNA ribose 2'-O-methyltransferase Hen1
MVGVDVSLRALEVAGRRLRIDRLPSERIQLIHGSLMYRDRRFEGFDAAAVVEVIEHLDPPRLAAFEGVLFRHARPRTIVLTTPNREYNAVWEALPAGAMRHHDHRFEWTRSEFRAWAEGVTSRHGYTVDISGIGPEHETHGQPTQMATFTREAA